MLKTITPEALAKAVAAASPGLDRNLCLEYAARLVRECDGRLEENVRQWLAGEALTDNWIGPYCLGMVMEIRGGGFLEALEALNAYCRDPEAGEAMIWRCLR